MKKLTLRRISPLLLALSLLAAGCAKKPDACFTIEKGIPSSKVNDEVEVNAACSTDATSYLWEWGDGASTTGVKVKHKYNVAGNFTIKMTAKNDNRESATSRQVTIVP